MESISENKDSVAEEYCLADTFGLLQIDTDLEPTSTEGLNNDTNCSVSEVMGSNHKVNTKPKRHIHHSLMKNNKRSMGDTENLQTWVTQSFDKALLRCMGV